MANDRVQQSISMCIKPNKRKVYMKRISVLISIVTLATGIASAQNLLLNGDFNSPNSTAAPDSWSTWSYGGGWANHQNNTSGPLDGVDGSFYMATGGGGSAGGGVYQTVAGTAGLTYQLTVDSGAQAWWLPYGEMRIFFLDASSTQLAEFVKPTVDPAVYGQNYDIAHPWSSYSLTEVAPINTAFIKVEFAEPNGTGTVWFDNASLTVVPEPSTLAMLAVGGMGMLGWRRISRRG
jgi:hypothetical protein